MAGKRVIPALAGYISSDFSEKTSDGACNILIDCGRFMQNACNSGNAEDNGR
jgi:hypothetical protein